MDGGGSIQVNHWRSKNLQYRFVIKLKYTLANKAMLLGLSAQTGGSVHEVESPQRKDVLWVENSRRGVDNGVAILTRYPPLTSRLVLQLQFLRKMRAAELAGDPYRIQCYFAERAMKYVNREPLLCRPVSALLDLPYYAS